MSQLTYAMGRPRFSIICNVNSELVAANTGSDFQQRIAKMQLPAAESFEIVDAAGDSWEFLPDSNTIAPGFDIRPWTKKRIAEMFNGSANARRAVIQYSRRSLSNQRLGAVVREVAELVARIGNGGTLLAKPDRLAEQVAAADRAESAIPAGRRGR